MRNLLFAIALFLSHFLFGQVVQVSPADLDFGSVEYGEADSLEISITNNSSDDVDLEDLVFFTVYETSPFLVNQFPQTIAASSTESFYVVFRPEHNISHNSELIIKLSQGLGAISVDLKGNCFYSNSYYNGTENLLDTDLKDALQEITGEGYITRSYDGARDEMYMVIDNQQVNGQGSSQTRLTRAYLGIDAVGYTGRSDLFNNYNVNCEHTFPQGYFSQDLPMRSDVHHLVPTDVDANSTRGNLRFGETVSGIDWSEGGSSRGFDENGEQVFEPRDGQKGHSARAVLYFVIRYQNYGGFLSQNMEETIKGWHFDFLPDAVERRRNDDVENFQNNRNPFIDYPQFAHRIFSFRQDEDRPNLGELQLSHSSIDFGTVEGDIQAFNLVLVNNGERFLNVSDIQVTGSGFSLETGQEDAFLILEGEAERIRVLFDPSASQGVSTGNLTFATSLPGNELVSIPLSADGILSSEILETNRGIHPNPANEFVQLEGDLNQFNRFEILDISGRVVRVFTTKNNRYDISALPDGSYLMRLTTENGIRSVHKLIKSSTGR